MEKLKEFLGENETVDNGKMTHFSSWHTLYKVNNNNKKKQLMFSFEVAGEPAAKGTANKLYNKKMSW